MRRISYILKILVKIPNIPIRSVLIFFVLKKAKGNKSFKQFVIDALNEKENVVMLNIYERYAEKYYPNEAKYIVAITFYVLLFLWVF